LSLAPEILQVAIFLAFVAAYALGAVYAERKVSAFIQDRLGRMNKISKERPWIQIRSVPSGILTFEMASSLDAQP
jgi:NADH:ubiquinone oxidoreductase subunit H